MTDKRYIVLYTEDGNMSIKFMTEKEIKENYLNENYSYNIFDALPNLDYDSGVLIIDGNIVVPKAKKKIVEWEL